MPGYNDGVLSGGSLATVGNTAVADAVLNRALTNNTTPGTLGGDAVRRVVKTMTFAGGAGTGAVGNVPLFTVTGRVLIVAIVPSCTTTLTGATATLALGVTGNTALFIAATTATDIAAGDIWVDATPTEANGVALPAALKDIALHDDDEIVGTVAVAAITGGVLEVVVEWIPLSSGASVVAA